jgi:hypothetical protein
VVITVVVVVMGIGIGMAVAVAGSGRELTVAQWALMKQQSNLSSAEQSRIEQSKAARTAELKGDTVAEESSQAENQGKAK